MSAPSAIALLVDRLNRPLTFVDVGARWGPPEQWSLLETKANVICFEPDESECARLRSAAAANIKYLPYALDSATGNINLYVTANPACSSVYKPIASLYKDYNLPYITPQRVITVPCRTMDDALADTGDLIIDCIKLDTQGSELDILRGATRSMAHCSFIDIEVEFNEIYENQNLFCDVDRFLRLHGFVLWRLSELAHYADKQAPPATTQFRFLADPFSDGYFAAPGGQLFWGQAQYVRAEFPPTSPTKLSIEKGLCGAVIAALYGYWDLALELVRKTGEGTLATELQQLIAQCNSPNAPQ